jgi:arylsulfatase A-like enzyme/sugar phosphate isomerase/epimerase
MTVNFRSPTSLRINMSTKALIQSTFFLVAVSACGLFAADRPPNVVLIVADDLGFADLGCYGANDIPTPNLDRLAKEGTRFTKFCVAQAVCTASRTALLSGCYPNRLGMSGALNHTSISGINAAEQLLPELLQGTGYATACYGKWHLGTRRIFDPNHNGFDDWFGLPYSNDNGPLHPSVRGIPSLPLIENGSTIALDPDQSTFTRIFTERSIDFIANNKSKPFFLYLPHVMPHVPIAVSKAYQGKSGRGLYGDVVVELDWSVGEILRAIHENGIDDHTLVLFLSDNGPFLSYGDHAGSAVPFREGKLTAFEGGVRVPLIARWPGHVATNRMCSESISGMDLLPTLAKVIGAPLPTWKIDGIDLSPLLLGEPDAKGRETFAYYSGAELHAVRMGRWKLHLPHEFLSVNGTPGTGGKPANFANMSPNAIEESGVRGIASRHGYQLQRLEQSLFDLDADPGEMDNVASKNPNVVRILEGLADEFRKELGDTLTQSKGSGLRMVGLDVSKQDPFNERLFAKENLMAWCIVPFDAVKRSPEQRAMMLRDLGIKRFAYDYRAEHIPSFEREIVALNENGIELSAWWFPTTLNEEAKMTLSLFEKMKVHPQLWVMGGGNANMPTAEAGAFATAEVERIRAIAMAAQKIGSQVALYNHGGWFGVPENQLEIIRRVNMPNVGIVFNLHHAHDQLGRLPAVLAMLKPHLLAININGMQTDGEKQGKKILPIGDGDRDIEVLKAISESGYTGPIGILNHTDEDAKTRLERNLSGLETLVSKLSARKTNN